MAAAAATTTTQQLLEQYCPMGLLLLALLLLLLMLAVTGRMRRKTTKVVVQLARRRLPPGPAPLPLLGNLHHLLLGSSLPPPHQRLRDLSLRHGPDVMLLRLGTVPTVVVSSASAARDLLRAHDLDCCSRPDTPGARRLSYGHRDVAFAPYGAYWREMRRLLVVELLSRRRVRAAWRARVRHVDALVADLTAAGSSPVVVEEHVFRLADGIIGAMAFGDTYGTEWFAGGTAEEQRARSHRVVEEGMDMLASFSAEDFFPNAAGRLLDRLTGHAARRERVFADLDAFFEMVIDKHTDGAGNDSNGGNNGDLVDALLGLLCSSNDNDDDDGGASGTSFRFGREHVKALILDTFLAGTGTVAVTLLWAMTEMMRRPEVLTKATHEVRAVDGDDKGGSSNPPRLQLGPDDVSKQPLTYLRAVVKETLRLHPPAALLPRETVRDVTGVCGYDVPAGTRVLVNLWAIGRDPASWGWGPPAPEEFRPERFEGGGGDDVVDYGGAHFQLIPFGAGRRICPGLAMGEANVTFALANLLYCFDWALPEGVEPGDVSVEETGVLTIKPKTPLRVVPTRRYPPGHQHHSPLTKAATTE